jgi:hypothetical protein
MDIIIRNGVIQQDEAERIDNIMNKECLLKKNFKDYDNDISGPYYDLGHNHICIPRKFHLIKNFIGPQSKNKLKLIENNDFNKKASYCVICHEEMKPNPSFCAKRTRFVEENIYEKKEDPIDDLHLKFKKIKILNEIVPRKNPDLESMMNKLSINKLFLSWNTFYNKIYRNNIHSYNLRKVHNVFKKNEQIIVNKYYQLIYKLIKEPVLYPISIKESLLLYPWELTPYQKFRLNCPDYKSSVIFIMSDKKITEKYVMIE